MKKTIMVVEDDSLLIDAYCLKFSHTPYDVVTAHNGAEALTECQKKRPDLIILDIFMPKMDGVEFLKRFMSLYKDEHIPILVATNNDQPELSQNVKKLGATDVFVKSDISIKDLVERCDRQLSA